MVYVPQNSLVPGLKITRDIKNQECATTVRQSQVLWERTEKVAWTRQMIPDIQRWLYGYKLCEVSYHMAQVLSGHGCFQKYLWQRIRADSPQCVQCSEAQDTVDHTIFYCEGWDRERRKTEEAISRHLLSTDVPELILGPDSIFIDNALFHSFFRFCVKQWI